MAEVSCVARSVALLGRVELARTLEACVPSLRRARAGTAREALLACVKLASPARPACPELAAVLLSMYALGGVDVSSAQHAVDTDGASLQCTERLASVRSLWLVTDVLCTAGHLDGDDQLALDCLARLLTRFSADMGLREVVIVLSACRKSVVDASSSPYAVAERMRAVMGIAVEITTSALRASFVVAGMRVVVVREFAQTAPGDDREGSLARVNEPIRLAFTEGAEARAASWAVVLLAPLSYYTLGLILEAPVVFSIAECEGAHTPPDMRPSFAGGTKLRHSREPCADIAAALEGRARAWVEFEPEATTPEALLQEPAIRVAVMEHAWRDAADFWVPREPAECRAAVRRCARSASACIGARAARELVSAVLDAVRRERKPRGADWHADLAAASARLSIALVHNSILLAGAGYAPDVRRAQPALAVLLAQDPSTPGFSPEALLRCAFAALEGFPVSYALAEVCAEVAPAADAGELLCVLFALFRARMQTVRDAEAALGCGRVARVGVETEVRPCAHGSFVYVAQTGGF
jgi:hypothetical protein